MLDDHVIYGILFVCNSWSGSLLTTKRISLMCFRGQPVLLLTNEQSDLGDAFQTMCSVRHFLFFLESYVSMLTGDSQPAMSTACFFYSSVLQPLLRHQHSLPNKGWPVRSSDLWTWSVYSILALSKPHWPISSWPNSINQSVWRNIFYKVCLSLLPVAGHDVLAIPVLAGRWRHSSCYLPSFRWRSFWTLSTCGSGLNSLSV